MNLTESIKQQANRIKELDGKIPIDLIVTHLERAEFLYDLATKEKDDNYYTDVIYRTNQVFEGALRIAYMVLNEKTEFQTSKQKTVYIEEYLTEKQILKNRVLDQFTNYRTNWRNPSTHDFKLLFTESESILAISNVSAFTYVLLNQVIQKLSYNFELMRNSRYKDKIGEILNKNMSPRDKLIQLLIQFNKEHKTLLNKEFLRESEILGALSAFLSTNDKIKLETDVLFIKNNIRLCVSLIIEIDTEKIVVEVKRPKSGIREIYKQQIFTYLYYLNIKNGLLFIPDGSKDVKGIYSQPTLIDDSEVTIIN